MRFMLIVKATAYSEAGVSVSPELDHARIAYKKSLAKAGILLAAEELQPSTAGIRISYSSCGGEPEVEAGPFPADQELMAEYVLIEVKTAEEALNWALRMPVPANIDRYVIEMRKLEEHADLLRDPSLRAMEADLLDQLNLLKHL